MIKSYNLICDDCFEYFNSIEEYLQAHKEVFEKFPQFALTKEIILKCLISGLTYYDEKFEINPKINTYNISILQPYKYIYVKDTKGIINDLHTEFIKIYLDYHFG